MKNITRFIFSVFVTFILISCSKDKDSSEDTEEQIPPSSFEISVNSSFTEATIMWTQESGSNNQNLKFAIFLNNELIIDDFSGVSYNLESLQIATEYSLRVVAMNDFGETQSETSFMTLDADDFTFVLKTFQSEENAPLVNYEYNELNQLISALDNNENGGEFTFEYDNNGNLLKESVDYYFYDNVFATFTYENNFMVDFVYENEAGDFLHFDFYGPNNYAVELYIADIKKSYYSDVILERNGNDEISNYLRTEGGTGVVEENLIYTYENGNITQIDDILNGISWNILFDDKKSFGTSKTYFNKPAPGIQLSGPFVYYNNFYIPEFVNFTNKNNPLFVYYGGQLVDEFTYEYNEFGYPSKIYTNGSEDPAILTYNYFPN